jgi:uncharacterized protein involved in type VI secretion and phage assembly
MDGNRFHGKYRGLVTDNKDPLNRGRIRARVPDVYSDYESGWALPCLPFAGGKMGFFAVPPVNAAVWMEFEAGDPDYPIWAGCRWDDEKELPKLPDGVENDPGSAIMFCTEGGNSILLDDAKNSGGITLKTAGGQKIVISSQGIEIDNGNGAKIKLSNNQVSVNDGALEVT